MDRIKGHRKIEGIFTQNPGPDLIKWYDKMTELVRMNIENKLLIYNIKYNRDLALLYKGYLILRSINKIIRWIDIIEEENVYI